jgi:hypothetical protein
MSWFLFRKPFDVVEETMYEKLVTNENCLGLKKSQMGVGDAEILPPRAHALMHTIVGCAW